MIESQSDIFTTKRFTCQDLEEILFNKIQILDHGFIRVIDYMGGDQAVVQAARVSYGKGTKTVNEDKGLINYLIKHSHTSPFEMCEIKFHIKLPIFIARQWIRHRTANVNEYSARYSIMSKEFYIPEIHDISKQSKDNKQGRGESISYDMAHEVQEILKKDAEQCYKSYENLLSEKYDLARELARMNLTLNHYTEWYWKIDLHNLLHFLALRIHPHAQFEIREYANKMVDIVKLWCPLTYEAFLEHVVNAKTFSAKQLNFIKNLLEFCKIDQANSGLSKREYEDVMSCFN